MKLKYAITTFCILLGGVYHAQVAMDFDGTNDYINCGTDASTAITGNALTVEAWIKPASFGSANTSNAVVTRINTGFQDNDGYALSVGNGGVVTAEVGYGTTTAPYAVLVSTNPNAVSLNTWSHIAMTFDGSILKIYVNGVLNTSAFADYPVSASTQPLAIGYRPQYNQGYFNGSIDEVRIWNTVRTQPELTMSKDHGACIQNPTGLVAYYSFEQGVPNGTNTTQTTLTDDSGNGNDGTLTNFALSGNSSNYIGGVAVDDDYFSFITTSSCLSYTSPTGQVYTSTGIYYDTVPGPSSCDSIYVLNLTIGNGNSSNSITAVSCGDYTSNSGMTYTSSGIYTENLQTLGGCDSTLTIDLTVLNSTTNAITGYGCESYTSPSGQIYTAEGIYNDTITNAAGCDSIITIDVVFTPVDVTVTQNEITLNAQAQGASYQWVDCDDNYSPISGETGSSFTATANGNYAVIVTSVDNCVDTSECFAITTVGVEEVEALQNVELYPNPNQGEFTLQLAGKLELIDVSIFNVQGQKIAQEQYENVTEIKIKSNLEPGVYMVTLDLEGKRETLQMIVK